MVTVLEDIADIFKILHDGEIAGGTANDDQLILTVACDYLANCIDISFGTFFVRLYGVDRFDFGPWTNPGVPEVVMKDLDDILNAELEILNAKVNEDVIVVFCYQHDKALGYGGGNLTIRCKGARVFDQNENEIAIDDFKKLCDDYWKELRSENN